MGVGYNPKIVTDGLVLALDAGNTKSYPGSGTTWTDVMRNYNGTLTGSPTYSSVNGGGLVLDGATQYGTSVMPNPLAETVIMWAKSATSTWNQYGWLSSSRGINGHIIHPWISTKDVYFYIYDSVATVSQIGIITPDDITIPHMYSYSTNGSNSHKMYLNNTLKVTSTTAITRSASPSDVTYYYGKDSNFARFGNGSLYNITRYNRQLSDDEISQNFNALRGRFDI